MRPRGPPDLVHDRRRRRRCTACSGCTPSAARRGCRCPVGQVITQAPQSMQSPRRRRRGERRSLAQLAARLAAAGVVADDERAPVEQHRLEAAVRAGDEADLLAQQAEVEEHQGGRRRHDQEGARVLDGRAASPSGPARSRRRSRRGTCGARNIETRTNTTFLSSRRPSGGSRSSLRWPPRAALDQALDRPVDELHVDRLRAGPAAPHAAEDRGDQEDPDEDPDEQEHQEHRVGRAGTSCRTA